MFAAGAVGIRLFSQQPPPPSSLLQLRLLLLSSSSSALRLSAGSAASAKTTTTATITNTATTKATAATTTTTATATAAATPLGCCARAYSSWHRSRSYTSGDSGSGGGGGSAGGAVVSAAGGGIIDRGIGGRDFVISAPAAATASAGSGPGVSSRRHRRSYATITTSARAATVATATTALEPTSTASAAEAVGQVAAAETAETSAATASAAAGGSWAFRRSSWTSSLVFGAQPKRGLCCMGGKGSKMAAPVIIPATARHTATVIFLHGLGDTGHGWSDQLAQLRQAHIKYICPTAPSIPVALNAGMRMPAWFNIYSLDADGPQDEPGIKAASVNIQKLVKDEENAGIAADRIMLGGFSMGGALALYAGCTYPKRIAGIVGLSTWLPLPDTVSSLVSANKNIKIFMGHGDSDDLVPLRWGRMTADHLKKLDLQVTFNTYEGMGHSSCSKEMSEMAKFIKEQLPEQ